MKRRPRASTACLNCRRALRPNDRFCPACGQEVRDLRLPLGHLLLELAEPLLHLESKSWRTLRTLVRRPGQLSVDFAAGRRVGQVPPLRFYIFVSFLFFLVLTLRMGGGGGAEKQEGNFSFSYGSINSDELRGLDAAAVHRLMVSRGLAESAFNRYVLLQMSRIASAGQAQFFHSMLKLFSYALFALLPLFALWLHLLYRKRRPYYVFQLVFALHFHAAVFLLLTAVLLAWMLPLPDWLAVVPLLLAPTAPAVYLFLALRRFSGEGRGRSLWKTGALVLLHGAASLLFLFATLLAAIFMF